MAAKSESNKPKPNEVGYKLDRKEASRNQSESFSSKAEYKWSLFTIKSQMPFAKNLNRAKVPINKRL